MKATPAVDLNATYTALVNEGSDFFDAKNFKAALSVYWKAFRLRPTSPVLLFNIPIAVGLILMMYPPLLPHRAVLTPCMNSHSSICVPIAGTRL